MPVPLRRVFTYTAPRGWKKPLPEIGSRVRAPFAGRTMTGFVVGHSDRIAKGIEPRPIVDIVDSEPIMGRSELAFCRDVARHYLAPLGEALRVSAPPGGAGGERCRVELIAAPRECSSELFPSERIDKSLGSVQRALVDHLRERGPTSVGALARAVGRRRLEGPLKRLEARGIVRILRSAGAAVGARRIRVLTLVDPSRAGRIGPRGRELTELLGASGGSLASGRLVRELGFSDGTLRSLVRWGVARFEQVVVPRYGGLQALPIDAGEFEPSRAQRSASDAIGRSIRANEGRAFLLHGVTGSGKTHVYLEAAKEALDQGRAVLVLVPEIALTPQIYTAFERRFPGRVAVLHSALSVGERRDTWFAIREGLRDVVVGVRSAVFAPLPDLGLIVVDEEHESSYKGSGSFPYHAREVARRRASAEGATLLLGSATPSLESYHQTAEGGDLHLLELPERVDDRALPAVRIADMVEEIRRGNRGAFSSELKGAIRARLEAREQIILLLNRRGYSPSVQCAACGEIPECGTCAVRLVYHRQGERLRCHYCGFDEALPSTCPGCGADRRLFRGWGTQRIEEELARHFPEARVLRLDQDATRRKGGHFKILDSFARREADILLGTQMVAKGLDLPGVTLVGVINADIGLSIADFRSAERSFQLLTQVSGRAGRGSSPGEVVMQTNAPRNYAIRHARSHDFASFYDEEIAYRRELVYPPFSRLIAILVRGPDPARVLEHAQFIAHALRRRARPELKILGPAETPVARVKGEYRQQLLIKAASLDSARKLLLDLLRKTQRPAGVSVGVDVDPERMG